MILLFPILLGAIFAVPMAVNLLSNTNQVAIWSKLDETAGESAARLRFHYQQLQWSNRRLRELKILCPAAAATGYGLAVLKSSARLVQAYQTGLEALIVGEIVSLGSKKFYPSARANISRPPPANLCTIPEALKIERVKDSIYIEILHMTEVAGIQVFASSQSPAGDDPHWRYYHPRRLAR